MDHVMVEDSTFQMTDKYAIQLGTAEERAREVFDRLAADEFDLQLETRTTFDGERLWQVTVRAPDVDAVERVLRAAKSHDGRVRTVIDGLEVSFG